MQLYDQWTESVGEKSQYNLSQPLICRDQATRLISVNFSPQVTSKQQMASTQIPAIKILHVPTDVKGGMIVFMQDVRERQNVYTNLLEKTPFSLTLFLI